MDKPARIAIVTDSAASIPAELRRQYRIEVVPFWVNMGVESYLSGIELEPDAFFRRLRAQPELDVSTGLPPIKAFADAYERQAQWASAIVAVHIAGKQSGTCNAAEIAGRGSPVPVVVVDSETTAMAEGFVALEAARAAAEGATLEEVVKKARSVAPNAGVIALLESIRYVFKGGRLSGAAHTVGSFLKIQPLVRVQENRVSLAGQVRRRSKGIMSLIEKVVDEARDAPTHIAVHYAEDEAEGNDVLEALKKRIHCVESYLLHVPIELGVHAGPGAIGVAYYVEKENMGLVEQLGKLTTQARQAIRSRMPDLSTICRRRKAASLPA